MSMMVSFVLSFFPRDVLDEILNLIESVSEDFPSYSSTSSTEDKRVHAEELFINAIPKNIYVLTATSVKQEE